MLLCLSSGSSRRYREDILRAAGLPRQAYLRFRYEEKYITGSVLELLKAGKLIGQEALIAYSDQADKQVNPVFVPCRVASIVSTDQVGTTVSVDLELGDWVLARDLEPFQSEIATLGAQQLPAVTADRKITGRYFVELNAEPKSMVKRPDSDEWQSFIDQIASRQDFSNYQTFSLIRGVITQKSTAVPMHSGLLKLEPSERYLLKLYQYHPTKVPSHTSFELESTTTRIRFFSRRVVALDSRYDHKSVSFQTIAGLDREEAALLFVQNDSENKDLDLLYELPLLIEGSRVRAVVYTVTTAVLLAAPNVLSALTNAALSHRKLQALLAVATSTALAAASFSVLKVRRLL